MRKEMIYAEETVAAFAEPNDAHDDRKLFVHNLGELLSQTRESVLFTELTDDEQVIITYFGGGTHIVNVNLDSYCAIIRDVCKAVT